MSIYLDGRFVDEAEACIPVSDRGFLFGDGIYVTLLVKEGEPRFLKEQLERLAWGCRHFGIIVPVISLSTIYELLERNEIDEGAYKVQIIVTGGSDPRRSLPVRSGHLLMTLKRAPPHPEHPLRCTLYPDFLATAHSKFKTLAHLNRYFVIDYALQGGFDDAITIGLKGELLESSFGNLFWVVGRELYTPDPTLPLHWGVTISEVQRLASELGFVLHRVKMTLAELPEEASLFRASSLAGIVALQSIDGRDFAVDTALAELFNRALHLQGACQRGA